MLAAGGVHLRNCGSGLINAERVSRAGGRLGSVSLIWL